MQKFLKIVPITRIRSRRFIFLGIIGLLMLPFVLPETIINRFLSIGNMAAISQWNSFAVM